MGYCWIRVKVVYEEVTEKSLFYDSFSDVKFIEVDVPDEMDKIERVLLRVLARLYVRR